MIILGYLCDTYRSTKVIIELCIPQAILCTHDAVAQKDYYPHLPDIPPEMDDEEETVKIVQLVKSDEPLVRIRIEYSISQ